MFNRYKSVYMKSCLAAAYLLLNCFVLSAQARKYIDSSVYGKWKLPVDVLISDNGKYLASNHHGAAINEITIIAIDSSWRISAKGEALINFSPDSKFFAFKSTRDSIGLIQLGK